MGAMEQGNPRSHPASFPEEAFDELETMICTGELFAATRKQSAAGLCWKVADKPPLVHAVFASFRVFRGHSFAV
jgi:hypothetical protein